MIHLGSLGGCVVERDGAPVTGRAAQRHHGIAADAVTLSPERVRTDVAAFIEAVADGRCEQAVPLYAGPHLTAPARAAAPLPRRS